MKRQTTTHALLYAALFPRPGPNDPPNWSSHLSRNLIPEIRLETARFYGTIEIDEARYPGLDYTSKPHIMRLSAFPHHNKLFRAIKKARLTDGEVLEVAKWEGTLWARKRYEKEKEVDMKDTAGAEIGPWRDPRKITVLKVEKEKMKMIDGKEDEGVDIGLTNPQPSTGKTSMTQGEIMMEDEKWKKLDGPIIENSDTNQWSHSRQVTVNERIARRVEHEVTDPSSVATTGLAVVSTTPPVTSVRLSANHATSPRNSERRSVTSTDQPRVSTSTRDMLLSTYENLNDIRRTLSNVMGEDTPESSRSIDEWGSSRRAMLSSLPQTIQAQS